MNNNNISFLKDLNQQQQLAVNGTASVTRVIAGPGTGKTTTLIAKILKLVLIDQVAPYKIVAVTFSNKAANEINDRLLKTAAELKLDYKKAFKGITIGTYHAWCSFLLRINAKNIKLPEGINSQFGVASGNDTKSIIKNLLTADYSDKKINLKPVRQGNTITFYHLINSLAIYITNQKTTFQCRDRLLNKKSKSFPAILQALGDIFGCSLHNYLNVYENYASRYNQYLKQMNMLDFADLILITKDTLISDDAFRKKIVNRYHTILLDEFQDTNVDQYDVVKLLLGPWTRLFVVGDPDQSIYAFRGSQPGIFYDLISDFDDKKIVTSHLIKKNNQIETDRRKYFINTDTIILRDSYRTYQTLLDLFSRVISYNNAKYSLNRQSNNHTLISKVAPIKPGQPFLFEYGSNKQQARGLTNIIFDFQKKYNFKFADFAILSRENLPLNEIGSYLNEAHIPYTRMLKNDSLLISEEIAPLIAYFRVLITHNLNDVNATINIPSRGFGESSLFQMLQFCKEQGITNYELIFERQKITEFFNYINHKTKKQAILNYQACLVWLNEVFNEIILKNHYDVKEANWYDWFKIFYHSDIYQNYIKKLAKKRNKDKIEEGLQLTNDRFYFFYGALKKFHYRELNADNQNFVKIAEKFCITVNAVDELTGANLVDDEIFTLDTVKLMTIHRAKGLEFPVVIIPNLSDGIFPRIKYENSVIEEERRVFYVAISRTKQFLILTRPLTDLSRFDYKKEDFYSPSTFLLDLGLNNLIKENKIEQMSAINNTKPKLKKQNMRITNSMVELGDTICHDLYGLGEVIVVNHDKATVTIMFDEKFNNKEIIIDSDKWHIVS